jgi:D-cysteine desulfhydrase
MIELTPTPVQHIDPLGLWVKRDDLVHPRMGGNKPRKLQKILEEAWCQGASRLLTFGAAGSHHVLATALFGRLAGFRVRALLFPQPRTGHALSVLRASVGQGVEAIPLRSLRQLPRALAAFRGAWVIPVGGSNVMGASAFVEAAAELRASVDRGELPAPREIVVATGSGGTAAGLAVGLAREGLPTRVVCVAVTRPVAVPFASVLALASRTAWRLGVSLRGTLDRLVLDGSAVGEGYGHPTLRGEEATRFAAARGLLLDPTYTAKSFAVALERARGGGVLYWHTLSSAPMEPLLDGAPGEEQLDPALRALLR